MVAIGSDNVVLKPGTDGSCVVEKYGASAYFTAAQWTDLVQQIGESKEGSEDAAPAKKTASK